MKWLSFLDNFKFEKGRDSVVHSKELLIQTMLGLKELVSFFEKRGAYEIYTRRFNQDILENFFGQIKASISIFTSYRFRLAFKANILRSVTWERNTNCEADDDVVLLDNRSEEFLIESSSASEEIGEFFANYNPIAEDKELTKIRDFINNFDPVGTNTDQSSILTNGICYFSGYILHYIKKKIDCSICIAELTSDRDYDELLLTSNRLYGEECNLEKPSYLLFSLVKESVLTLSGSLANVIYTIPLRKTLASILQSLNFSFIPTCHNNEIKQLIIYRIINTLLTKYLKDERARLLEYNRRKKMRKR